MPVSSALQFLYTKRNCQELEAGLWRAQIHVRGQSYQVKSSTGKCVIRLFAASLTNERGYKLAVFAQPHKALPLQEEKQFQERDCFAFHA